MKELLYVGLGLGAVYLYVKASEAARVVGGVANDIRGVTSGVNGLVQNVNGVVRDARSISSSIASVTNAGAAIVDGFRDLFGSSGSSSSVQVEPQRAGGFGSLLNQGFGALGGAE